MKKHILSLCMIHILLACLILVVQIVCFNRDYYHKQFSEAGVANTLKMSDIDINRAMDDLLDYLEGKVDQITVEVETNNTTVAMFNEKEIDHMVDVKNLYQNALVFMYSAVISVGITVVILLKSQSRLFDVLQALQEAFLLLGVVIGFVVIFALLDFDSFWTTFHRIFFSNELWLLNPRTDRMIVMLNLDVFMGIVYQIILYYAVLLVSTVGAYFYLRKRALKA